jgi:Ribonuclease toxin, BrnT, of type II toxin-antitoxin system
MEFEWDEAKAEANFRKHGVSFMQAQKAFDDLMAVVWEEYDSSGRATLQPYRHSRRARPSCDLDMAWRLLPHHLGQAGNPARKEGIS